MGCGIVNDRYRNKRINVQAWQHWKGAVMPMWVVGAMIEKDGKVLFKRGAHHVVEPNQGDWIVRDDMGNVSVFTADEFQRAFEEDVQ